MAKRYNIIYETAGAAKEYAELGCNLFGGCTFGCKYCYGPKCMRMSSEEYHSGPNLKANFLKRLTKEAEKMKGDPREILLCFIGDVCQTPYSVDVTQQALEILGQNNLRATILTKGGMRAEPLFPVLKKYGFSFGTSLVFTDFRWSKKIEPNADLPFFRSAAIYTAKIQYNLRTWVSLEPVIVPSEAILVIRALWEVVDHWKVGKINHMPELEKAVDWYQFYKDVTNLLDSLGASYMIKDSLERYEVKP